MYGKNLNNIQFFSIPLYLLLLSFVLFVHDLGLLKIVLLLKPAADCWETLRVTSTSTINALEPLLVCIFISSLLSIYPISHSFFGYHLFSLLSIMNELSEWFVFTHFYLFLIGQQPFGGARASGTNDKAGSSLNLLRWVSTRSIKENFNPLGNWTYPYMG